jgi:RNA-splicing ligase RtcB
MPRHTSIVINSDSDSDSDSGTYEIKILLPEEEITCKEEIKQIVESVRDTTTNHRFMADCHPCPSTFVGWTFVLNFITMIKPSYIGNDIGCGICTIPLEKIYNTKKLEKIVTFIKDFFPMGEITSHKSPIVTDDYISKYILLAQQKCDEFSKLYNFHTISVTLESICRRNKISIGEFKAKIGTLGGGNHFIEFNENEKGKQWLTVHTGSRAIGQYILENYSNYLDKRGYLITEYVLPYIYDMIIAQVFAKMNRHTIMEVILDHIGETYKSENVIESYHNYIDFESKIVRKGAISAKAGEQCIVSLNMKEGILICTGLGNNEYNQSCAHGCGRNGDRKSVDKSRKALAGFKKEMADIVSLDINEKTLDESPMAYKDSKLIIDEIGESVKIVDKLRAILNVKG